MKCVICKVGETQPGHTEVVLRRGELTLVVRGVPADVCGNCSEGYFTHDVSLQLEKLADEAFDSGVEVQIMRWQDKSQPVPPGGKRVA